MFSEFYSKLLLSSSRVAASAVSAARVNNSNFFFNNSYSVSSYRIGFSLLVGTAAREERYAESNSE